MACLRLHAHTFNFQASLYMHELAVRAVARLRLRINLETQ